MPRPNDSPDVAASKTLAYILRHGAEKEMLDMRSDGYLRLNDVLARPKMRGIDTEMVLRLVAENAKQRFELFYGYDSSPPRPKARKPQAQGKGKGKGKGKGGPRREEQQAQGEVPTGDGAEAVAAAGEQDGKSGSGRPAAVSDSDRQGFAGGRSGGQADTSGAGTETKPPASAGHAVDAAQVDDLAKNMAQAGISTELPLVALPRPTDPTPADVEAASNAETSNESPKGEYFIRATQGHSIKLESVAHLEPVKDDEDGRSRAGECVHGTRWELWDTLKTTGLSRMARTHIHLAPALSDHAILPRPNSTLRIYLSVPALLAAGIPLYTSLNGVVLTPGDADGVVRSEYWRLAERKVDGQWVTVWQDGREVVQVAID